jgi:hypothetical protein
MDGTTNPCSSPNKQSPKHPNRQYQSTYAWYAMSNPLLSPDAFQTDVLQPIPGARTNSSQLLHGTSLPPFHPLIHAVPPVSPKPSTTSPRLDLS